MIRIRWLFYSLRGPDSKLRVVRINSRVAYQVGCLEEWRA
jgi:hypothetical protein